MPKSWSVRVSWKLSIIRKYLFIWFAEERNEHPPPLDEVEYMFDPRLTDAPHRGGIKLTPMLGGT